MSKVAFIGLGVMGFPMAGHLKAKGYDVIVYNRTGEKADAWAQKHGGKSAPTPAAAAKDADFVMTMVGNDKDVEEVILGKDGVLAGMKKGSVLVDHTTASADVARKVYAAAKEKGVPFIDAPVSGGQAGAENGKLTVMCRRRQGAVRRAKPGDGLIRRADAAQSRRRGTAHGIEPDHRGPHEAPEGIAFAEKAGLTRISCST
jgi:3-hydroxyisobutyrate dehydrogenase/2-hydroxy-3-oxopropionate reductase